ncbi:MAG: alpha/beta hydrolase, partial [Solirubrobacterales bacterium]|nr:alpha/beta hydrolase [Solirubrobacterales bacterium]
VLALLDALGLQRVYLVGHDWGGYVGHLLALRAPERFHAYLCLNIAHPWITPKVVAPHLWRFWYQPVIGWAGVPLQMHTPLLYTILRYQYIPPRTGVSDEDLRWFTDRFRDPVCARAGSDTYKTFWREELPKASTNPETRRSQVPTRAVFGVGDKAVHWTLASARSANAEDYTLELIADTGHFITDERPDIVRDRLVKLVAEFPSA